MKTIDDEVLLKSLNEEQEEAVRYIEGDSLILAGAGSGKTRVLTTKVAYLIANGYPPYSIMALTFTNKAAREMRDRIASIVGHNMAMAIPMGTFHSIFSRMLRRYASLLGYTGSYTIYDTTDSKSLIKQIVKDMGLNDKTYKPSMIQSIISSAKNSMVTASDYYNDPDYEARDRKHGMPKLKEIYRAYDERCRKANAMDFDDLLLNMLQLLQQHQEVRKAIHNVYKFILVDEYQDTNRVQHKIVQLLCGPNCNVCVVGDDSQSIYSFRGALIDNILQFKNSFPEAKLFKLTKNYRSTSNIVNIAGTLIKKNSKRIPKEVVSVSGDGAKINLFSSYSANIEAQAVAARIKLLIDSGENPENIAILYRTNAQSRILEDTIRVMGISVRVYGGMSFYERKEVKDVIAYMRLVVNPNDDEAFRRVYNFPKRGIGATTFNKLNDAALANNLSYMATIAEPGLLEDHLSASPIAKLRDFVELIDTFREKAEKTPLDTIAKTILTDSGLYEHYSSDKTAEGEDRMQNISELINAVSEYMAMKEDEGQESPTLDDYLREVALYTDKDEDDKDNKQRVTMMTMHASKGLEYDHVFIVGVEDGLIPSERSLDSQSGIEEERRLLYVAITRAKKNCYISFAYGRSSYGKYMSTFPSRFIYDMDPKYIENESDLTLGDEDNKSHKKSKSTADFKGERVGVLGEQNRKLKSLSTSSASTVKEKMNLSTVEFEEHPSLPYAKGDRVKHHVFGDGTVQGIMESAHGLKIRIHFDLSGEKSLIAKYAKLNKIK